jgi:hypothetical protein
LRIEKLRDSWIWGFEVPLRKQFKKKKKSNAPLKRGEDPVIGQEYLRKSYQADDLK